MATPAFQWGWREEENLVNSHVKRPRKNRSTQSRHRAPQAAARRLGANWIAYGPEENDFLESCFNMDPNHSGTSATTLMVKRAAASTRTSSLEIHWVTESTRRPRRRKQHRQETGSMYRFDFVRMKQINAQTGYERSMKRFAIRDAQAAPAAAAAAPGTEVRPAKKSKPSPAPAAAPTVSPPARAPRFGGGGRDAADAIDVDDEPRPVAAPDFVSRLQALSALHREGHLTDAEFAKAKQKLLDE